MAKTLTQPLKRHGGKGAFNGKLAHWIISLMPPRDGSWNRFVEPYAGSLSVLLNMDPEGLSEFANDLDGELMNFWGVLRSPTEFKKLKRFLECTPLSEKQFSDIEGLPNGTGDRIDRAFQFFIRCRQSRQGLGKDYVSPTKRTRRGMNEQVSAWLSAVDGLPGVVERLRRVEVWNRPALEVIDKLDSPETVFYFDPPYLHETRASTGEYGKLEMTEDDHRDLLDVLTCLSGRFLLSGYPSPLYDVMSGANGWKRHTFQIVNNASSKKTKDVKTECVWTNFTNPKV